MDIKVYGPYVVSLCNQTPTTVLGSIVNTTGRAYMITQKRAKLHFDLLQLLHLKPHFET